jgi:hypothetical protein
VPTDAPSPSLPRRSIAALGASLLATLSCAAIAGAARTPVDRVGAAVREAALQSPSAVAVAAVVVFFAVLLSEARLARLRAWHDESAARARSLLAVGLVAPTTWASRPSPSPRRCWR